MNKIIITTSLIMLSFVASSNENPENLKVNKYDNIELSIHDKKYTSIAKKAFYHNNSLEGILDIFNKSINSCIQQNKITMKNKNLSFSMKFNDNENNGGYYNIYSLKNSKDYILEGVANYYVDEFSDMPTPDKYLCEFSNLVYLNKSIDIFIN
jgi:hypothetical protein